MSEPTQPLTRHSRASGNLYLLIKTQMPASRLGEAEASLRRSLVAGMTIDPEMPQPKLITL